MLRLLAVLFIAGLPSGYAQNFSAVPTGEGGSSTGGAELKYDHADPAWYLGHQKTLSICIAARSASYPISEEQAKQRIGQAYRTWREYVTANVLPTYGEALTPSTLVAWEACTPQTQIKIYLGSMSDVLADAAKKFVNPRAFVYQGSIWFGHNHAIEVGNNFLAMALHEIGHTLGVPHVNGTIMTADIALLLHQDAPQAEAEQAKKYANFDRPEKWEYRDQLLAEIDYQEALVANGDSDISVNHAVVPTVAFTRGLVIRSPEKTFEVLTGAKAKGKISITFNAKIAGTLMSSKSARGAEVPTFELILSDSIDSHRFELDYDLGTGMQRESKEQVFVVIDPKGEHKYLERQQLKLEFTLTSLSGKEFRLVGTYWGGRFLNLDYIDVEPALPEIFKADPEFDEEISAGAETKLRKAKVPFHLFFSQSDLVQDQLIWK